MVAGLWIIIMDTGDMSTFVPAIPFYRVNCCLVVSPCAGVIGLGALAPIYSVYRQADNGVASCSMIS